MDVSNYQTNATDSGRAVNAIPGDSVLVSTGNKRAAPEIRITNGLRADRFDTLNFASLCSLSALISVVDLRVGARPVWYRADRHWTTIWIMHGFVGFL
ncbi:hypothetical protein CEXT_705851 [Caerostris extrusa]|uniref:Uncharacterized protein n=1 Tax=Caerostris extrusa TaxID=172846 RepID=A0AAV4VPT8_CAEEX|nr:hypothetical protein CEXT_705851 [Caerostris extrusa]